MTEDLTRMLAFWLVFSAVECACGALAYRIDGREGRLPVLRMLAMRFGYRQLLYAVVIRAVGSALHGVKVRWGAQQRSGNMTAEAEPPITLAGPDVDRGDEGLPPMPVAA